MASEPSVPSLTNRERRCLQDLCRSEGEPVLTRAERTPEYPNPGYLSPSGRFHPSAAVLSLAEKALLSPHPKGYALNDGLALLLGLQRAACARP